MKLVERPGSKINAVKIGVPPVRSFVTTMLVNAMLPALLTVPL